jgi:hypothetical protein
MSSRQWAPTWWFASLRNTSPVIGDVFSDKAQLDEFTACLILFVSAGWLAAQSLTFLLAGIWREAAWRCVADRPDSPVHKKRAFTATVEPHLNLSNQAPGRSPSALPLVSPRTWKRARYGPAPSLNVWWLAWAPGRQVGSAVATACEGIKLAPQAVLSPSNVGYLRRVEKEAVRGFYPIRI